MKRRMNEDARDEWEDLKKHWTASRKPKGQREWDGATRSISASKKAGEPRYKYEDIVDYDGEEWIVKGSWVREDKGENEYKLTNMDGTETIYVLQSEIEKPMHESRNFDHKHGLDMYDESWIGDKVKSGWEKVKTGAKKVGKAIGDAFKGPFRKGDQIVMKGENGEEFKGTIKSFDLGNKTYEVLLGNSVNEGLQEDVLDMADREDELVWMIQDSFWHLADLGDQDILRELIENCVELEKVKPGKLKEIISDEF